MSYRALQASGQHDAMMLRAGAVPTVGGYGFVRWHLPSVKIFAYFPSLESMKKMLRAGGWPMFGMELLYGSDVALM